MFLRRSQKAVQEWFKNGCPGEAGNYDLFKILEWCEASVWAPRRTKNPVENEDRGNEDYEAARADLTRTKADRAAVEFEVYQGTLVEREKIRAGLHKFSSTVRGCGELLQQQFGEDALRIVNESMDDAEAQLDDIFDDHPEGDDE